MPLEQIFHTFSITYKGKLVIREDFRRPQDSLITDSYCISAFRRSLFAIIALYDQHMIHKDPIENGPTFSANDDQAHFFLHLLFKQVQLFCWISIVAFNFSGLLLSWENSFFFMAMDKHVKVEMSRCRDANISKYFAVNQILHIYACLCQAKLDR
jgi:hypothetical protein